MSISIEEKGFKHVLRPAALSADPAHSPKTSEPLMDRERSGR